MKISDLRLDEKNILVTLYAFTFDVLVDRDKTVFALWIIPTLEQCSLQICLKDVPNKSRARAAK